MKEKENTNPQATPDAITVKYAEAVRLYASTEMTGKQIALQCGLSLPAFRIYLRRHHRSLMLRRNGLEVNADATNGILLRKKSGQTPAAYQKYKQAIDACDDLSYIQYNVSQIARLFGLDGTALGNQLKLHYPEIIERREKARTRLGLKDNFARGAKPESVEIYAQAVEMLRSTDKNLPTIAEECGVSLAGLSQYLRFYHKDLVDPTEGVGDWLPAMGQDEWERPAYRAFPRDPGEICRGTETLQGDKFYDTGDHRPCGCPYRGIPELPTQMAPRLDA